MGVDSRDQRSCSEHAQRFDGPRAPQHMAHHPRGQTGRLRADDQTKHGKIAVADTGPSDSHTMPPILFLHGNSACKEAFENQEVLQYAKSYYRKKGVGRPTKKDRRDLEDFANDEEE